MKKKVLTVALAVALLAIMVSGSLAYFTAEDKATNTFTVGSVRIDIWENGNPTDTDTLVFEKPLVPVVNMGDPVSDVGYAAKAVKVKNTGKSDAYIRLHIAVPTSLIGYLELKADLENSGWIYRGDANGSSAATVAGVEYTVFTYDYQQTVVGGGFTAELLKGAYLRSEVDIQDNPATASADLEFCKPNGDGSYTFSGFVAHQKVTEGYASNTVSILVAAEAIQAQGFDGATNALNSGFGQGKNPWQ